MIHEVNWGHEKLEKCQSCDLNSICSWVYEYEKFYNYVNVYPQKLTKDERKKIIDDIKR
jgi:hypothetical protein